MAGFDDFSALVARLLSERRVAIFCGAGVSRPSGLPIVSDVLGDLFEWARLSAAETRAVSASAMPFERVMELVLAELPFRESFLDLFNLGSPSLFHEFVAALHRRRLLGFVATTNFDRLVERALAAPADVKSLDVDIEPKQLLALGDGDAGRLRLIKLHGCVSQPHTMATELYMVGSSLLTPARRRAVECVFQTGTHSHVLIVGYSCSDAFDIEPILHSLNGGTKTVLFVNHRSSEDSSRIRLEDCECPPSVRSFTNWKGIAVDTSQLIQGICDLLQMQDVSTPQRTTVAWRPAFASWLSRCDAAAPASRDLVAGALLAGAGLFEPALARLESALLIAKRAGDSATMCSCHLDIAHVAMRHTGEVKEARSHTYAARHILGKTPPRDKEMVLLQLEAELDSLAGDFAACARRLERVLELCETDMERGLSEYALAIVRRKTAEFEKSESHFLRAIAAYDAAGSLVNKARAVGDLGNLYVDAANLEAASRRFEEGLALSRLTGDKHGERVRLANLANVATRKGETDRALTPLLESIEAARAVGDASALSSRIGNLGMVFYQRRELDSALVRFNEALAWARKVNNRDREARWIANLGITLARLGRSSEAIQRLEEAERLLTGMLGADHPRVQWVGKCLILARSEAIENLAGDDGESGLMTQRPDGRTVKVTWDMLAP
jgi:tetratricopeptide (TPR) repeat protein